MSIVIASKRPRPSGAECSAATDHSAPLGGIQRRAMTVNIASLRDERSWPPVVAEPQNLMCAPGIAVGPK